MDSPHQLNARNSPESHEVTIAPRQTGALKLQTHLEAANVPLVEEPDDLSVLMQYLWILWKHKWALVFSIVVGLLAGLGVSLWMTPLYRARASMEIQNVQETFGSSTPTAGATLPTQAHLLQSAMMRERARLTLSGKTVTEEPETEGMLAYVRNLLGLPNPVKSVTWDEAAEMAAARLTVTIPRDTNILVVQTDSANPLAAADFANTLTQEYMSHIQQLRWEFYQSTGEWLTRAQEELKEKVEQSEQRLAEFARARGLLFTSGTENVSEDRLRQLQTALLAASTERIAKQSIYESSLASPTESLPSVLDSGPMAQYQVQIADLRRELAELNTTLLPAHYRVQQVQAQIDELEAAREKERTNIISRIQIEYDAALKRENELREEFEAQTRLLAGQADGLIAYNILMGEVNTNKRLYEAALQHGKEASLASAMRTSTARIVDLAAVPVSPVRPNVLLNMSLGMLGTVFCGAVFIIARSRSDVSVQAPGTLQVQLNVRELGIIPAAAADPEIRRLLRSRSGVRSSTTAVARRDKPVQGGGLRDCLELVTWSRRPSIIAEAFRSTMTSILFSGENGNRPRTLVITSPSPQEGKSTIVSNLAIALAEVNQRVLIIDADMRLPRLHNVFDVPNTFGLSDLLGARKPVNEYLDESLVRKTHIPNLCILSAGPARTNLSRLLYSTRMNDLIDRFRDTFDIVLIDTAPVLNFPDSRLIARVADAVILVVRAHQTHQEAALAAARCFAEDGRWILGTILNDWNPDLSDHAPSYYHRAGYYSRYLDIEKTS